MADHSDDSAAAAPALSRDRVLRTAVALADSEGIDALSMRRLGRELGSGAMSLYHHVRNKDELLDGMIDLVFAEIQVPAFNGDWKAVMRLRALSARGVLARHPWAINLMESRTAPGPANLRHREAVTATLRRAGFSIEMATHANWLLDSYIYGFALQEVSLPFADAEELGNMAEEVFFPQIPAEEYPFTNEAAVALINAGYDPAHEFTFGLDLLLDALDLRRTLAEP